MGFKIAGRTIGDTSPFVIAEAGVNHNGSPELALELVDAAAAAGADAVKFQTFRADALALPSAPQARYQRERAEAGSQRQMLQALELPTEALRACRDRALERGIVFLSTPFDLASVQVLVELEVPAFKIGSGDLTNLILLRAVAALGRPMIVSTGMATLDDVIAAVATVQAAGNPPMVLLQCTSAYPAAPGDANLRAMATLRDRFGVLVGYSDHTLGITSAIAATALGAAVIEKHLTLDRTLPGPDQAASLEPAEFAQMVVAIRDAHASLGDGIKVPSADEADVRMVARRSLVVVREIEVGQVVDAADLDARRPATGLSPMLLPVVIGRRAARRMPAGTILRGDDLDPPVS